LPADVLSAQIVEQIQELPRDVPDLATVERMLPFEYNNLLISRNYDVVRAIYEPTIAMLENMDSAHYDALLQILETVLADAEARTRATPAWHGDMLLRDQVAQSFHVLLENTQLRAGPVKRLFDADPMTNEVRREVETLVVASDRRLSEADAAVKTAQREFAERHGRTFVSAEPEHEPLPEFESPGLPPAGSQLPAADWVVLSGRYQRVLTRIHNDVIDAMNGMMTAPTRGDALEIARRVALKEVRAADKRLSHIADWSGDHALLDAVRAEVDWSMDVLRNDGLDMSRIASRGGPRDNKEVDEYNAGVNRLNTEFGPLIDDVQIAHEAFEVRWQFAAYSAFIEDLAARLRARHGEGPTLLVEAEE